LLDVTPFSLVEMFQKHLLPPSEAKLRTLTLGFSETSLRTTRLHYTG